MNPKQNQCPNCASYKTLNMRGVYGVGGILIAFMSIPWVFILIGIPFLIAGVVIAAYGFSQKGNSMKCRSCNFIYPNEKP